MRISSLFLLSAFVVNASGKTFKYEFPSTGSLGGSDYYQVCVKKVKWADLITSNFLQQEQYRYDISSTDFRNGNRMDAHVGNRYAVNVPDNFECKGGILFQADAMVQWADLKLTLKATPADGDSKLTVCAFYGGHEGKWADALPADGFDKSFELFEKMYSGGYKQNYDPNAQPFYRRVSTLCREFDSDSVNDSEYFEEEEPLPPTVTYTFPEVGATDVLSGICINGAQLASATNSVDDYPKYEMSTRKFKRQSNIWFDSYWWETNRYIGRGNVPMYNHQWSAHTLAWTSGNPCDGALYLQPQRRQQNEFYSESPRFTNTIMALPDVDRENLKKNEITVEILPEENKSSVQICALVKAPPETSNWLNLENHGFTSDGGAGIGGFFIYCKDVDVLPPVYNTRVTMKLQL